MTILGWLAGVAFAALIAGVFACLLMDAWQYVARWAPIPKWRGWKWDGEE